MNVFLRDRENRLSRSELERRLSQTREELRRTKVQLLELQERKAEEGGKEAEVETFIMEKE